MKASGKTITFAPAAAASSISRTALSTQASLWNGTDPACTSATRTLVCFTTELISRSFSSYCIRLTPTVRLSMADSTDNDSKPFIVACSRPRCTPRSGGSRHRLTHQRQLIAVGVREFSQPELGVRRAMDDVGLGHELDSFLVERRKDRSDIRHPENRWSNLVRGLPHWRHSDQQADVAALKKCHPRWSRE